MTIIDETAGLNLPENQEKVINFEIKEPDSDSSKIVNCIKADKIALVKGVTAIEADDLMQRVCTKLKLFDSLQLQTAFAKTGGNRSNIGKYYMSVNQRDNYEYITAHSEGGSFSNVQLASFFCYENSTDGGENIFMNVNEASPKWSELREHVIRVKKPVILSNIDAAKARYMYHVTLPDKLMKSDDILIKDVDSIIEGLELAQVLTRLEKTHSVILDKDVYVYWDTVGSVDIEAGQEYLRLLKNENLLKESGQISAEEYDYNSKRGRRVWQSGIGYDDLFSCKVTRKLAPGDFVIMNNLTWTHSATNWTPGSGVRKISAAFA